MKLKKISLRQLFSNTKFLIVFSLIVAFLFWIVVALEYAPVVENEIKDIPVKIDMKNSVPDKLGLQIFGQSDFSISITVKGNRYIVGGDLLSADDFDCSAQTAYVDSAGKHSLLVKVTAKDANADYEIISKSADYIDVYFDKYAEKEIKITPRVNTTLKAITDEDYYFDEEDILLNSKTLKISGAQTDINAITSAYADIQINKKLTESETVDSTVSFLSSGKPYDAKYVKVNGDNNLTVPATLQVYKMETVTTNVDFKNAPSNYISAPLDYIISPAYVHVAVLQNGSERSNSLSIGSIDFNSINPKNSSFTFNADDVKDVKFLDGTDSFNVELDLDNISSTTFSLRDDSVMITGSDNLSASDVDLSSIGKITVVGKTSDLSKINSSMLEATIDLSNVELKAGENSVPVSIKLKYSDKCWISGKYNVIITK